MTLHKIQTQRNPDLFAYIPEPSFAMGYKVEGTSACRWLASGCRWEYYGEYLGAVTAEIREGE